MLEEILKQLWNSNGFSVILGCIWYFHGNFRSGQSLYKPKCWFRYEDNTNNMNCVASWQEITPCLLRTINNNNQHQIIRFTMKTESHNSFPKFLKFSQAERQTLSSYNRIPCSCGSVNIGSNWSFGWN